MHKLVEIPHPLREKIKNEITVVESMESDNKSKQVVLSYIRALDSQDFTGAASFMDGAVHIKGPGGESFSNPNEFMGMLKQYRGKYDLKKVFVDGDDVCVIYDYVTPMGKAIMCSWYLLKGGKINFIQTIFDPSPFEQGAKQ